MHYRYKDFIHPTKNSKYHNHILKNKIKQRTTVVETKTQNTQFPSEIVEKRMKHAEVQTELVMPEDLVISEDETEMQASSSQINQNS